MSLAVGVEVNLKLCVLIVSLHVKNYLSSVRPRSAYFPRGNEKPGIRKGGNIQITWMHFYQILIIKIFPHFVPHSIIVYLKQPGGNF